MIDRKRSRFIAINNSYGDPVYDEKGTLIKYIPRDFVDIVWFGDPSWYEWHYEWLKDFSGLKVHCSENRWNRNPELKRLDRTKSRFGIETKPGFVCWNKSSGASAINLAYHLGAKRIILLGYDMRKIDGKKNWHQDHKTHQDLAPFKRFLKPFLRIAEDLEKLGVECLNATEGSAINVFPFVKLEEVL